MSISLNPLYRINDFFETYAKAIEHHDTKLMTNLYQTPCTMLSDDATTLFNDMSRLEGVFNQGVSFYKRFGIVYVRPDVWSKYFPTNKIAQVKVNWQYLDEHKKPVYDFNYHYVLKLNKDNQWKIVLSISIDEKEKMEEWKNKKRNK